jgi:polyferredoxin
VTAFAVTLALRTPLKVDVIRDRGAMGRELEDGAIENVYRLQVMNTSEQRHVFRIGVAGIAGAQLMTPELAEFDGASARALPVRVRVPQGAARRGSNRISFTVIAQDAPALAVTEHAVFLVPK